MNCPWGTHEIGTKIYWVTDSESTGTIMSEPYPSEATGTMRQDVLWDNSKCTTAWHPDYLVPAGTEPPELMLVDDIGVYVKALGIIVKSIKVIEINGVLL